ncbi:unnamed protein product [Microthlaspi erraticum]|uniref:Secreted protein n=1 Tax=Microthlaspi erraticum TaxID=1685480 RepID=A0A6D2HGB1_9BRAS|nr:unnamed protein product [Microthlaspi erraticum]
MVKLGCVVALCAFSLLLSIAQQRLVAPHSFLVFPILEPVLNESHPHQPCYVVAFIPSRKHPWTRTPPRADSPRRRSLASRSRGSHSASSNLKAFTNTLVK